MPEPTWKTLLKRMWATLNTWQMILVLLVALLLIAGKPYYGNYIETNPLFCSHYKDLYFMDSDPILQSCKLTCARDVNCSVAWSNETYFDTVTGICHCGKWHYIDYSCYYFSFGELATRNNNCYTYKQDIVVWG